MTQWRALLSSATPAATRYRNMVNTQVGGANLYGFEPWYAAWLSQITATVSYCSYAVTRTEAFVASEEASIARNQRASVAGDSYLEVGPQIGNLALVYDWCRPNMTDAQRTRWRNYANQAVWNVWNPSQARWGATSYTWTGWSVDNPVNNYYYSFLEATMLLGLVTYGENDWASEWIDRFRNVKIRDQLVPTFNRDLTGGGSREGTGYGTAMKNLWRLYDWWERSTGERIATLTPHTLASMAWTMHAIVPTLDRLAPTGDHARDSGAALFDYHRDYLQVLMRLFPAERLSSVAKSLLAQSSVPSMTQYFMYYADYLYDASAITARPLTDLSTAYWASGTGQFAMRNSWTTSSAYANLICGPYSESHAHRDQGSFVLFKGNWLAYDANIDGRSGIEQDEKFHNLVRFEASDGTVIAQRYGQSCNMQALANTPGWSYGMAQATPVYPAGSAVVKSEREFLFIKPATFVVFDRAQTSTSGTRRIWSLNLPSTPTISADAISLAVGSNRLNIQRLAPNGASVQSTLWSAVSDQYRATPPVMATRVDVTDSASGNSSLFLHVMGLDGAVTSSVRADAAGQTGATITLADGRVATVRFNNTTAGGTLEIRASAGGAVLESGALPTTVQAPPLFVN